MPRIKPSIHDEMSSLAQWSDRSLCRRVYAPSDWDTVKVNDNTRITEEVDRARNICLSCPVMMDCLIHAVAFEKTDQIWGGLTDEERTAWAGQNGMVTA